MPKVIQMTGKAPGSTASQWLFWCPGCQCHHSFKVPPWTFNGDLEKPTVRASILVHGVLATVDGPDTVAWKGIFRCHSFITDGKIQFLNDCEHPLKGQTVDLPDVENL